MSGERVESGGGAAAAVSRAESAVDQLRTWLAEGEFGPGERLSEAALSARLDVSRNTLREAFQILVHEGLLVRQRNRGVSVVAPTPESIMDVYLVRRFVECRALRGGRLGHPAIVDMRDAVAAGGAAALRDDWNDVGTANMAFHRAIIALADSPRIATFARVVTAELRIVFRMVDDPRRLHEPYLQSNRELLALVEEGRFAEAADRLDRYLSDSERNALQAFARRARS